MTYVQTLWSPLPAIARASHSSSSSSSSSVSPIMAPPRSTEYQPMVANRPTRTPHSGYHFDGTSRRFFEGWYFQVALPDEKQSFAWMYTSENPGSPDSTLQSGAAQVLGADEEYLYQDAPTLANFWAARHELALGNTYQSRKGAPPPTFEVNPKEFWDSVEEGYQVTPTWHQGCLRDNGRTDFATTVETIRWEYSTRPVYGWGSTGKSQSSTAGWLAILPVFEPHWQICMASGLSTGWIEWGDRRFEFEDAPSYCEKNWGGSFPQKWFWLQCTVFDGCLCGEVALTAGGGRRGLPLLKETYEDIAVIGVHYQGEFYEFVPWKGEVEWEIMPWGSWKLRAQSATHEVKLEATTDTPGCLLRCPVPEGFKPLCNDTFSGKLKLQLWERRANGSLGKMVLETTSSMCAVETGGPGDVWKETWTGKAKMKQPFKALLQLPINPDTIYNWVPALRPPGY